MRRPSFWRKFLVYLAALFFAFEAAASVYMLTASVRYRNDKVKEYDQYYQYLCDMLRNKVRYCYYDTNLNPLKNEVKYILCTLYERYGVSSRFFINNEPVADSSAAYFLIDSNCVMVDLQKAGTPFSTYYVMGDYSDINKSIDQLEKYRLIRDPDGHLYLSVSIKSYTPSVEHMIKVDSGKGVLQCVKVVYNKEKNTVATQKVTVSDNPMTAAGRAWTTKPYLNGKLDEDAETFVKKQLPEGGEGYLLTSPVWNLNEKEMVFKCRNLTDIRQGDILCMKGGNIEPTGGNDFYVPCTMTFDDGRLLTEDGKELKIQINRRNFSFNENTLRVYYIRQQYDVFCTMMMVRIYIDRNNRLCGTLRSLPVRPSGNVRDWLEKIILSPHVVIGREERQRGQVYVEIRPGVFCLAKPAGPYWEGVTGRLFTNGDDICVEAIGEGDQAFAKEGRIVELLVLDSVFHKPVDELGAHFTVSGLPQLMLKNNKMVTTGSPSSVLRLRPPRYGIIGKSTEDNSTVQPTGQPSFGYLKAEVDGNRHVIRLYHRYGVDPETWVPFHHMSYLDGGVPDLWRHIRRGQWHCHDQKTLIRRQDGNNEEYIYPKDDDLPILFRSNWSLRYTQDELQNYAFPPNELEEYGFPGEQHELKNQYPVAGSRTDGLYVELMPGRIVSLPQKLIRIADCDERPGKLCTRYIRPGDTVTLTSLEPEPGKPVEIQLMDIRYSLRSFIESVAYLPVVSSEGGTITLGGGLEFLRYPGFFKKLNQGQVMKLDQENELLARLPDLPESGSIVMVYLDDQNEMRGCGFEKAKVMIAETGTKAWSSDIFWMKSCLKNPTQRKKLVDLMKGMIPLRVETVNPATQEIAVSYPQPDDPESGEVICCQVIGVNKDEYLLIRSGAFISAIRISELFYNSELARIIQKQANKVFVPGMHLWIRRDHEGKYRMGLYAGINNRRHIKWKMVVNDESDNGFLCTDIHSREWLWMPATEVSRAKCATADKLAEILKRYTSDRTLNVSSIGPGRVSWLKNNAALQKQFQGLVEGDREHTVNVIVVSDDLAAQGDQLEHVYLCCERPQGNIYELHTELPKERGETVEAVCLKKDNQYAELIPSLEIRTPLQLSSHLLKALHTSTQSGRINRMTIQTVWYPPQEELLQCFSQAKKESDTDAAGRLIMLCGQIIRHGQDNLSDRDPEMIRTKEAIRPVLTEYLETLAQNPDSEMTLPQVLAISILTRRIDKALSKNIYKLIARNADLYCCEEILLEKWLINDEPYGMNDLRRMMENLDLRGLDLTNSSKETVNKDRAGELTEKQRKQLIAVCETILRRYRDNEDKPYAQLALSLLYVLNKKPVPDLTEAWQGCLCNILKTSRAQDDFLRQVAGSREEQWFEKLLSSPCRYISIESSVQDSTRRMLKEWHVVDTVSKSNTRRTNDELQQ